MSDRGQSVPGDRQAFVAAIFTAGGIAANEIGTPLSFATGFRLGTSGDLRVKIR